MLPCDEYEEVLFIVSIFNLLFLPGKTHSVWKIEPFLTQLEENLLKALGENK